MSRRHAAHLLLTGVVLAAPLAGACSLAEQPEEPGFFVIWDPASGDERRIDVPGKQLGAGCELSNPHDLRGQRFAWAEADGQSHALRVIDIGAGTSWRHAVVARPDHVALADGWVLYSVHSLAVEAPGQYQDVVEVHAVRPEEGIDMVLQHPVEDDWEGALAGSVAAWMGGAADGPRYLAAYELLDQRWLLEPTTLPDLGLPDEGVRMWVFSETTLHLVRITDGQEASWAYDLYNGTLRPLPSKLAEERVIDADGSTLYIAPWNEPPSAVDMRTMQETTLPRLPYEALRTVDGGSWVLGSYFHDQDRRTDPAAGGGPSEEERTPSSPAGFALLLVLAALVRASRRPRQ